MTPIDLFHTGFLAIPEPDIRIGRRNADFGQGFYTSPDEAFSRRWARSMKGWDTWLNRYALDPSDLKILDLARGRDWFAYISGNRAGRNDPFAEYDIIRGPIANDTIYDTWGITTSGLLTGEQSLHILSAGPQYVQVVLKTDKAAAHLRFLGAQILPPDEIARYRETVKAEEQTYQTFIADYLGRAGDP